MNNHLITIFGTGSYGIALGKRFHKHGFKVTYGSRNPNEKYVRETHECDFDVNVLSIRQAWLESNDLIIFAIRPENYESVVNECHGEDTHKIVIDVSNCVSKRESVSNAEQLQLLFKNHSVSVVKAFNTMSAYSMCDFSLNETIAIASNDREATQSVIDLCSKIGLRGYNIGKLDKSQEMETWNKTLFNEWKQPTQFVYGFFVLNLIWFSLHSYLTNPRIINLNDYLAKFSILTLLNRVTGFMSIQLLSFVYLPGLMASFYQLIYKTKNKPSSLYLDLWLKSRKYLGLWSFFMALIHLFLSLITLNQGYYTPWFKANSSKMTLHGELNVLSGLCAFLLMCPLAFTSIRAISLTLNWSEWIFVQTKLGYLSLFLSFTHVLIMWLRFVFERHLYAHYTNSFILSRIKFISLWLPFLVLSLKLFTLIPRISQKIHKVRNGHCNKEAVVLKQQQEPQENINFV